MFRFVTAGESHGQALIAWITGLPAGVRIDLEFIQNDLHRRQLGYGRGGRQKIEKDRVEPCRYSAWANNWRADRPANRKSRLGQLGESPSRRRPSEDRDRDGARYGAATRSCRPGWLDEIQPSRRAVYSGARLRPGNCRAGSRRRDGEAAAPAIRLRRA